MLPLKQAIAALKSAASAPHVSRINAALMCVLRAGADGKPEFWVVSGNDTPPGGPLHTITVEIPSERRLDSPAPAAPVSSPAISKNAPAPPAPALTSALSGIFGAPGFDNSARASVFVEIMEGLSPLQAAALIQSFRADPAEVPVERPGDSSVAAARTRVTRLVKLGPAGLEGVPRLIGILEEYGLAAVLQTVRTVWKSQDAWIDTTPPGVRIEH